MKAAISFDVYGDFYSRIKLSKDAVWEDDWDYSDALKHLNEIVAGAVKNKTLTFKYGRRVVKPILPIEEGDYGNIFNEDMWISYWNDVEIWCEIPVKYEDFDWDKFMVDKCPEGFEPRRIYVRN